jgi:hypothetical protein
VALLPLNDAFWRWFGRSVVRDGDRPLRVFHLTNVNFDRFKIGVKRTSKRKHVSGPALWFAPKPELASAAHNVRDDSPGAQMVPVYLRIENALEIPPLGENVAHLKANGLPFHSYYLTEADVARCKELGIDGIIQLDKNAEAEAYVVFSPGQVKSVFNSGTWSRSSHALLDDSPRGCRWCSPRV